MERIENVHGPSYETFWSERFPRLLKTFLDDLIAEQRDRLNFSGPTKDVEIARIDDFSRSDAVSYCRERALDLTPKHQRPHETRFLWRHSQALLRPDPQRDPEGGFILNGKERFILAQLVVSPGLFFSKETTEVKYPCESQYFDIEWTVFKADLIPSEGVWLEFILRKLSPGQEITKIPLDLQNRIRRLMAQ